MPVRNGGKYVQRAVVSTLRAMPKSAELLIMDDGSADDTAAILRSIKDSRLRVYRRRIGRGVALALNSLIEESQAPYLARMDADDVCLPWRFALQAPVVEQLGGVVFSNVVYCTGNGLPIRPTFRRGQRAYHVGPDLLVRNPFVHPTMVASRNAIEAVGGYREIGAEDYDLWLRLAANDCQFSVVSVPTIIYRQHSNQVTASSQAREELRTKWFGEPDLVDSWSKLADKEYGLRLNREFVQRTVHSVDEMLLRSDFLQAHAKMKKNYNAIS